MKTAVRTAVLASIAVILMCAPCSAARRPEAVGYVQKITGEVWLESGDNKFRLNPQNRNHASRKLYANEIIHCVNGGVLELYLYKTKEDPQARKVVVKEATAEIKIIGSQDPPEKIELDDKTYRVPGSSGSDE